MKIRMGYMVGLALLLGASGLPTGEDDGLVAYFSFNHCDARDDSGQGSMGELHGAVRCWCGIEGSGLLLDGETAYLAFVGPINDYFTTSDFTLSFYFKPEARSAFPLSLVSKREACNDYHVLDLQLDYALGRLATVVQEFEGKSFQHLSPELDGVGWVQVMLVREGMRARTYVNGELRQESFRCSGIDLSNDAPLAVGNSPCVRSGRARRFRGIIDELRVYDRALGDEEARRLYQRYPIENAAMDCAT